MAGKGNYLRNADLNHTKGATYPAAPTTGYVGLSSSPTGPDAADGTELTGGSYARAAITLATVWSAISTVGGKRRISNAVVITFPTASGAQGTATHWFIHDDDGTPTGNRMWFGALDQPWVIVAGKVPQFAIGALVLEVD